jgi:hypothetical protein
MSSIFLNFFYFFSTPLNKEKGGFPPFLSLVFAPVTANLSLYLATVLFDVGHRIGLAVEVSGEVFRMYDSVFHFYYLSFLDSIIAPPGVNVNTFCKKNKKK